MEKAEATHIKANILFPIAAPILTSATLPMTFRNMTNMTVAIMEAVVVNRAVRKVNIAIGKAAQREYTDKGVRNIRIVERQAPVRKRPNMTSDAILMRFRMSLMLAGSAIDAPARSSLRRI